MELGDLIEKARNIEDIKKYYVEWKKKLTNAKFWARVADEKACLEQHGYPIYCSTWFIQAIIFAGGSKFSVPTSNRVVQLVWGEVSIFSNTSNKGIPRKNYY